VISSELCSDHLLEERREVGADTGLPRGGEAVPELGCRAEHRAWLRASNELGYGMRGQVRQRLGLWRWHEQAGSRLRNPQHHGVAVGDEDIAHTGGARAGGEQRKAAPVKRMAGVGDLDFRRVVYRWVVDRGIKVCGRLTPSIMTGWYGCWRNGLMTVRCCG
jgi:hypothetical protein